MWFNIALLAPPIDGYARSFTCQNNATWSTNTTNSVSCPLTGPGNALDVPYGNASIYCESDETSMLLYRGKLMTAFHVRQRA